MRCHRFGLGGTLVIEAADRLAHLAARLTTRRDGDGQAGRRRTLLDEERTLSWLEVAGGKGAKRELLPGE